MTTDQTIGLALRAIDDTSAEIRRDQLWLGSTGGPLLRLPDLSEAEAERRASVGKALVRRIEALDFEALPGELRVTAQVALHHARIWSREADWWWLVFDPLKVAFFSLFAPTAYSGGFMINTIHKALRNYRFDEAGDLDRYRGLLADYARLLDQFAARTKGQAERGIRMPRAQFDRAVELFGALRSAAPGMLAVEEQRTVATRRSGFAADVEALVASEIVPAYDRLLAGLDAEYRSAAPETVGMAQYPRGLDVYAELVCLHTTLSLTPEAVHATGHERMGRIAAEKLALARDAGHADAAAFERAIEADPLWRSATADGVRARFEGCADRIAPSLDSMFYTLPKAGVAAVALPSEVSGSMTFGYYGEPTASQPEGTYFFNAENLTRRALPNVAALTYHELMPGHHLHVATQLENESLPDLRRRTLVNAFNEGWAEYAATLAGELGMYSDPVERYGRLMMDAFLTCRLVVDTGMNALGWTLEEARDYLREHGGMSEAEVDSEVVRYSCDIPAQALAYKLGDDYFVALREEMRNRLGESFDIRDFHAAAVGGGSLPLPLVAQSVRRAQPRTAVKAAPP